MFPIQSRLVDNICSNAGLNILINEINTGIYKIAKVELDNIRYGFSWHVDYDKYVELYQLREILLNKMLGCNCLEKANMIQIISKIKRLLN